MVIYKTVNKINGKIYIGKSTTNQIDYLGSGVLLQKAIRKYGKENFEKVIIEECNSIQHLNEREIYWISNLNTTDRKIGYNIAIGGNGGDTITKHPNRDEIIIKLKNRRYKVSEEGRKNISAALKGLPKSESHKQKLSAAITGKKASDETKQKLSQLRKGRGCGKDNPMYGKSAWNSGMNMSESHKNKLKGPREKMAGKNNSRYIELSEEQIDIIKNNFGILSKAKIKMLLYERTGLKICTETLNRKISEFGIDNHQNIANI